MADEFTPEERAAILEEAAPVVAAQVETPPATPAAEPAKVETPPAEVPIAATPEIPNRDWNKGLMLEQQKRSRLEAQLAEQQKKLEEFSAQLAKAQATPPPPAAPDEFAELEKAIDNDDVFDSTIHGRQAVKKLIGEQRKTAEQLKTIANQAKAAEDRATAAEKKLQEQEQARADEVRANAYWDTFKTDPATAHIKVDEAKATWDQMATKYTDPVAAIAAFETWTSFQKPSATPAAAKPAAPAQPAITPPSRVFPGSNPPPSEDPNGDFTEDQLAQIANMIS